MTMWLISSKACFFGAAAAFAVFAFAVTAPATDLPTRLQQLADDAALAGVTALGTSDASSDAARREEALNAARQALAALSGLDAEVSASVDKPVVTVKLAGPAGGQVLASSTARYMPAEQPANWAWASRQKFALKRTPVVVGANCLGCGTDAVR